MNILLLTPDSHPGEPPRALSRIAALNDALRQTGVGGRVMLTAGVATLPRDQRAGGIAAVQGFDAFSPDNDPHDEHDFGLLRFAEHRFIFKIDYYDQQLRGHSPNPADPAVTTRVLTIMLAEEY